MGLRSHGKVAAIAGAEHLRVLIRRPGTGVWSSVSRNALDSSPSWFSIRAVKSAGRARSVSGEVVRLRAFVRLPFEQLDQHGFDLAIFGMAAGFFFREDPVAINDDVENPFGCGNQCDPAFEKLSELFENVLRQPGGSFGIASLEAEFDRNCVIVGGFGHGPSSG